MITISEKDENTSPGDHHLGLLPPGDQTAQAQVARGRNLPSALSPSLRCTGDSMVAEQRTPVLAKGTAQNWSTSTSTSQSVLQPTRQREGKVGMRARVHHQALNVYLQAPQTQTSFSLGLPAPWRHTPGILRRNAAGPGPLGCQPTNKMECEREIESLLKESNEQAEENLWIFKIK